MILERGMGIADYKYKNQIQNLTTKPKPIIQWIIKSKPKIK